MNGRAEILLGQFESRYLSENQIDRAGFDIGKILGRQAVSFTNKQQVATKFAPYPWRVTRGSLVQAAKESLKRLEQEKLTVAQLHWSTANYQPFQEGTSYKEHRVHCFIVIWLILNVIFFVRCIVGRNC